MHHRILWHPASKRPWTAQTVWSVVSYFLRTITVGSSSRVARNGFRLPGHRRRVVCRGVVSVKNSTAIHRRGTQGMMHESRQEEDRNKTTDTTATGTTSKKKGGPKEERHPKRQKQTRRRNMKQQPQCHTDNNNNTLDLCQHRPRHLASSQLCTCFHLVSPTHVRWLKLHHQLSVFHFSLLDCLSVCVCRFPFSSSVAPSSLLVASSSVSSCVSFWWCWPLCWAGCFRSCVCLCWVGVPFVCVVCCAVLLCQCPECHSEIQHR